MPQQVIPTDVHVQGLLSCVSFAPPANSVGNAAIPSNAAIEAQKFIRHESINSELAASGSNIAAITKLIHIARAAGVLMSFEVAITGAMTGDRTVSIDLQCSTGGGAFASVLTATIDLDSTTVVRTATPATINTTAVADGDLYQIVVTIGGSTGTQPQGLIATLHLTQAHT